METAQVLRKVGAPVIGRLTLPRLQSDQTRPSFFCGGCLGCSPDLYQSCDPAQYSIQGRHGMVACVRREMEWNGVSMLGNVAFQSPSVDIWSDASGS